jgi:hypothetical protein
MKSQIKPLTKKTSWRMSQPWRKFVLTLHVGTSVGWLGAALGMLILTITAIVTKEPEIRRAAYTFMHINDLAMMIPLGYIAFITGILLSLGTNWGVFKYYWIVVKLVLTTFVLIFAGVFTQAWVREAITVTTEGGNIEVLGANLLVNAISFLIVFWTTTTLSTYKPWGKISDARSKAG